MDKHDLIADAAEIIDTLTSNLPADHPLRASACNRAKRIVGALYELADEVRDGGSDVGRNQAPAIRALLAERDDVLENGKQAVRWAPSSAHWSNELKRLFGEDAREGIDALEDQLRTAQAERDALREALQSIVDCCDEDHAARDYASRQTEIRGIARAAHAQEQS